MTDQNPAEADLHTQMREHAAARKAILGEAGKSGGDLVTFVDLKIGLQKHRYRLDYNGLCDVELAAGGKGPMEIYRSLVTGAATTNTIIAILTAGLKGGGTDKPGPIVDRIIEDRPLGEALAAAETILSAALVGAPAPKDGED